MNSPLIAIDGPAGTGKSTTSQAVARRLGLPYLDTGALYRAAAYAVIKKGISTGDSEIVAKTVLTTDFIFVQGEHGTHIQLDGTDVTSQLRTAKITRIVSEVCEVHKVRIHLVDLQRKWAARGFGVMEGRDIGTVVLPNAGLKIFLTARPEIRALRRAKDLGILEDPAAISKLTKELAERDRRDAEREDSPLKQAKDAILLDTSDLTFEEQVNRIVRIAADRFAIKVYSAAKRGE